jgi:hypothetical protein
MRHCATWCLACLARATQRMLPAWRVNQSTTARIPRMASLRGPPCAVRALSTQAAPCLTKRLRAGPTLRRVRRRTGFCMLVMPCAGGRARLSCARTAEGVRVEVQRAPPPHAC